VTRQHLHDGYLSGGLSHKITFTVTLHIVNEVQKEVIKWHLLPLKHAYDNLVTETVPSLFLLLRARLRPQILWENMNHITVKYFSS
jgi:hypothetical protein